MSRASRVRAVAAPEPEPLPPPPDPPAWRVRAAVGLFALWIAYGLAESFLWRGGLWGAHALGFLPRVAWVIPFAALSLFLPGVAGAFDRAAAGWRPPSALRARLPLIVGVAAAVLFWLVRERHLFWGDARPLSINVPAGQRFHPDEPLTLWLHHVSYALGRGRWSATAAIAVTSALAGGIALAVSARALLGRVAPPGVALLACAVWALQGGMAIFHGHVENYAFVTAATVVFLWSGLGYLERRSPAWPAFAALLLAFAFHLLGALLALPALVLVVHGLASRERRGSMLATLAATLAAAALASWLVRDFYAGGSPLVQLADGVQRVLTQPLDMQVTSVLSWRRAGDVWSHIVQMGPLSLVPVALLALVLGVPHGLRDVRGVFLVVAALGCYGPALLTGEGNLGAARNWDLFAGPSLAVAFAGLVLLLETGGPAVRQRLLIAALAASLVQSVAWTALGMDVDATRERVAALPLGRGRGAAMLGTDHMNAGRDPEAERWFRRALTEDSLNVNAWSGLGIVLARNGRYTDAEPALRRVVELKPMVAMYRQDLAVLYMQEKRWAEAAGQWQSALVVDHTLSPAWLGLAEAMRQQGHADSSVYVLSAAARERPGDADVARALADGYAYWVASAGQRGDVAAFSRAWEGFVARFPEDPRVREWRPRAEAMLSRGGAAPP